MLVRTWSQLSAVGQRGEQNSPVVQSWYAQLHNIHKPRQSKPFLLKQQPAAASFAPIPAQSGYKDTAESWIHT